jgi:hypothetical protein
MWSVSRRYKKDKSRILLVVRESPGSNDVNTEIDGSTALEAVIRQRLVKAQHIEKT